MRLQVRFDVAFWSASTDDSKGDLDPRVTAVCGCAGGSASYQVQNDEELFREASWAGLNRPGRGVSVSSGGRSSQLSSGEGGLRVHFSSPLEMPPQLHKGPRHRVVSSAAMMQTAKLACRKCLDWLCS